MSRPLEALEQCHRFRFGGSSCLYRDHLGRRVIADLEGSGFYQVVGADTPIQILRGFDVASEFTGTYAKGLQVVALASGDVDVQAYSGATTIPDLSAEMLLNGVEVAGTGWVIRANGPLRVDGPGDVSDQPGAFPAPFYRSAICEGGMQFVRASTCVQRIGTLNIDQLDETFTVQNMSVVSTLESTFGDGEVRIGPVASHLNAASWELNIPVGAVGLILEKVYDRFHGRQRARVLLNGRFVGWWYDATQNRDHRWGVSRFGVPRGLMSRGSVKLTIDPPAGSPLWSLSSTTVYAMFD